MPSPRIKICGIATPEALDACIAAQAEYVGFNFFPPSPRYLSPADCASLGQRAQGRTGRVGLFVDASDEEIAPYIASGTLDALQLHGKESPERTAQVKARFALPVWKVLSISSANDVARARDYREAADFLLFDAKTPKGTLPGGMGLTFDWSLLAAYRGPLPWGLAGGLTPGNVAEAAMQTGASLVDTSSGVESAPGAKDPGKIAAFCRAARSM